MSENTGPGAAQVDGERNERRRVGWMKARWILSPLWLTAFCPLVFLVPLAGVPVFLAGIGAAVCAYRLAVELRRRFGAGEGRRLERRVFLWVFLAGFVVLFQVNIVHDAFQYYAYLSSACMDGDLNLYDDVLLSNAQRFYNPFPAHSGRYIGVAVMEAPFFAAGHALALTLNRLGCLHALNGHSFPYFFTVSLASGLFALAGLVLCYRLAAWFFGRETALIAVLGLWFASPLTFFMYSWNGWPHPFAACLLALFLLVWHRTRGQRTAWEWAGLGAIAGWMCLLQPIGGLIFLFPLLEVLCEVWHSRPRMVRAAARAIPGGLLFLLALLAVFSPQFSLWKLISGHWMASPYREVGDSYHWLSPNLRGFLFATAQHGAFAWTPLLLVAMAGIPLLWRRDRLVAAAACACAALTVYVYSCWSIWWSGVGFSNRFLTHLTPLLVLGLGALLSRSARWVSREFVVGGIACAIVWNLSLIGAYRRGAIPMGIPDPFRVADAPLAFSDIVREQLLHATGNVTSLLGGIWINQNWFWAGVRDASTFRNVAEILGFGAALAAVGLAAAGVIRLCDGAFVTRRRSAKGWIAGLGICLSAALAVHGAIRRAAPRAKPFGLYYHFDETTVEVRHGAEDAVLYGACPDPVTAVDLLTYLVYGQGIGQGDPVAEVEVTGTEGEVVRRVLRAGVDTAESSYPRPEYRKEIRHGIAGVDVVRSVPTRMYSRHPYEFLTYRAVIDLPRPMTVHSLRFRGLCPVGYLVVSDAFLRDF